MTSIKKLLQKADWGIQFLDKKEKVTRLIQKMIVAKKGGEQTKKPEKKEEKLYHCDTMENENQQIEH
jgi:hypothetical protein